MNELFQSKDNMNMELYEILVLLEWTKYQGIQIQDCYTN